MASWREVCVKLSPYPAFGIQLSCFLAKLEMEDTFTRTIVSNGAYDILGVNLLTLGNRNRRKVTVNRYVAAMTDEHIARTTKLEDSRNHTGENGTGTGS